MESFVQTHEPAIRLGFFIGIFAIMAQWEIIAPPRALSVSKAVRWANNLGLVALNTVVLRLLFPAAAVAIVCRTDKRSAKAALLPAEHGLHDIHVMRGGMTKWHESGLPVIHRACGTCMDARGLSDGDILEGAIRSSMQELSEHTLHADQVLTFQ